jgi:hypothetical protein
MMLPIPHNPKKIEMLLLLCAIHRQPITITMTCSICQQKGHNKQTCSVVVRYEYDDCGVKCRINPNDDQDFQPVETYCLPCGSPTLECECGEYKCGKWFNEEKGKFQGAPRRRRQTKTKEEVATTGKYAGMTAKQIEAIFAERERKNYEELVAPILAPKSACADCGQIETECHLERLVGGKVMCCDCLYLEDHPDATCHRCDTKLYGKGLVMCGGGGGECETWYCATCHADGTHDCPVCDHEDEDDDETVSVESEDTCECCGRPYDHRNPHRQSEMCDCVQNDDGTLSRPEDDLELPCPDCRRWFDEGRDNCKSCDFDLNSFNKPPSPTRDQLVALGKYKLAKFQIGKREQKDETNWNEDGDDELCSAIDASGNALY